MNTKTDYEIILECLGGDQDQFSILITRHKRLIYKVVYQYFNDPEDVNDISQEVFINIYKSLGRYNPEFKFSTWASRIAVNLCLDILRKKKIKQVSADELEFLACDINTPEKEVIKKEEMLNLWKAIHSLSDESRSLLLMFIQKGTSYQEMADMTNQPISIIKNRLHRARKLLKKNLLDMELSLAKI